ncbi:hypothetical protein WN55_06124 [Dufourea novaeangliae]|uniref:Uncharacterized protein n=1 Tax=Dufourea novaeangliae TaxID=178035 RepID=A0A154P1X3_DUFNO|nr:hypothetical protein WN55_06124 [Dufourea novaeangliae]
MSRNPRAGTGLTRTQQLREARTVARIREIEQKEHTLKSQADALRPRRRIDRPEPKKVDFHKPGMTKAMLARVKQAEKFKQEYEQKKQMATGGDRIPKRTAAPIGGDARVGRERMTQTAKSVRVPATSVPRAGPSTARKGGIPRPQTRTPEVTLQRKTTELAKMMNADVITADTIGEGPIRNIVIPPGTMNENVTTIISLPQPADAETKATSQIANRSIQVISESLDEQDAVEAAAVRNKLEDLQQARRDFVMAVANVGGNAVNIADETPPEFSSFLDSPPSPPRRQIIRVPDIESDFLKPEYGRDHPDVIAAREFLRKAKENLEAREAEKRLDEEFERVAAGVADELQMDVPFHEELYVDKDISWAEDDETGTAMPVPSRVKAYASPIPQQAQAYKHKSFDPDELEKFFDVQRYPPCPHCGPPSGREDLHPDLWDLDDPWFRQPPQPDVPDLIEFDLMDFD